jgi:hypothetical protein
MDAMSHDLSKTVRMTRWISPSGAETVYHFAARLYDFTVSTP